MALYENSPFVRLGTYLCNIYTQINDYLVEHDRIQLEYPLQLTFYNDSSRNIVQAMEKDYEYITTNIEETYRKCGYKVATSVNLTTNTLVVKVEK